MNMEKAVLILGTNRTRDHDIRPMVKALKMLRALNTDEEEERLAAGEYVLRRWTAYQAACEAARDARYRQANAGARA